MTEYIISTAQILIAAKSNNVVIPDKITGVEIRGDRLHEIVRCRDCKHYDDGYCYRPAEFHEFRAKPDGFCAWAERREQ